ncbi:segregation/condensation protein A [Nakamurella antarctica]|uniref:Segregation and condensation protein A n=2 Tax=Nakamurella antarctica TaxID=1902245 RepID=A0A3G8ZQ91_9ACTN|nr:segregation/condensation protein A [Nakamurella antarctica]
MFAPPDASLPAGALAETRETDARHASGASGAALEAVVGPARKQTSKSFHISLANFDGPFDLLLQLISQHRMDVTEVALHTVTDEFISHLKALGNDWDLGQVTEFLVVAATLLDLKAARLLPDADVEDEADLALLEARDLLFARLMAYKAYKQVSLLFRELEATAQRRYPRAVTLEARYLGLLPEVNIGLDAAGFHDMASRVFAPKPPPEQVSLLHIHSSPVSVGEHTQIIRDMLVASGTLTFSELVEGCTETLEVIARFLGLLNLFREAVVLFDQPEPLGELKVRWTGEEYASAGITTREEYE